MRWKWKIRRCILKTTMPSTDEVVRIQDCSRWSEWINPCSLTTVSFKRFITKWNNVDTSFKHYIYLYSKQQGYAFKSTYELSSLKPVQLQKKGKAKEYIQLMIPLLLFYPKRMQLQWRSVVKVCRISKILLVYVHHTRKSTGKVSCPNPQTVNKEEESSDDMKEF